MGLPVFNSGNLIMDAVSYVPDAITFMPASFNVTVAKPSGSSNVMVSHPLSTVHSTTLSCVISLGFGPEFLLMMRTTTPVSYTHLTLPTIA